MKDLTGGKRRGHRLLSKRKTHLDKPSRRRRGLSAEEGISPPAPGRAFVIGPVDGGGSDIGFQPPVISPGPPD
jgi:hypothetical protein